VLPPKPHDPGQSAETPEALTSTLALGAGMTAGVLFVLRGVGAEARREMLEKEQLQGLKAICAGLRLKSNKAQDQLIALIEETLAHDEALCAPGQPLGKVAQAIGQLTDPAKAAELLESKYKLKELRTICRELRIPQTGKKVHLARQITQAIRDIWSAMSSAAPMVESAPAEPPQREPLAEAGRDPEVEARPHKPGAEGPLAGQGTGQRRRSRPPEVEDILVGASDAVSWDGPAAVDVHVPHAGDVGHHVSLPAFHAGLSPGGHGSMGSVADVERHGAHDEGSSGHGDGAGCAAEASFAMAPCESHHTDGPVWPAFAAPATSVAPVQRQPAPQPDAPTVSPTVPARVAAPGYEPEQEGARGQEHELLATEPQLAPANHAVPQSTAERAPEWDEEYGVGVVETEAVADEKEEMRERRQQRTAERRRKLMGYLAEEVAGIYGQHKEQYITDLHGVLQGAPEEARMAYLTDKLEEPTAAMVSQRMPSVLGPMAEIPEFGAWHSEPVEDQMVMIGETGPARQAWCKWWDRQTGCGELVDLDDQSQVAVVSAALTTAANVSPRLKYLRHGEFVEYRRVDRGRDFIARAVLVRGLRGWPLMCEVEGASLAAY